MSEIPARIIGAIIAAAVAVMVIWAAFHFWGKSRSQAAQTRVEQRQGEAASENAKDAIGTVAASTGRETASEQLTRENERDIRSAAGANQTVNPASRDAGIAALCKRSAYRNDPRCKER